MIVDTSTAGKAQQADPPIWLQNMTTPSSPPPALSVLTFNVWGLKFISKDRTPRMAAIAEYLATHAEPTSQPGTGFDIVCLQECWVQRDFETIRDACKDVFPYTRYFHTYVLVFFLYSSVVRLPLCVPRGVRECCNVSSYPFLESWRSYVALFPCAIILSCPSCWSNPHPLPVPLFISGALGSGLAILSKFPIISAQALPYSLSGLPLAVIAGDFFVNKAAGSVVVLHPELGEVEIWNTHVSTRQGVGDAIPKG